MVPKPKLPNTTGAGSSNTVQCPVSPQSPVSSGVMLPPAAWKLCQTLLVHGLTVVAVLNSHEWMHLPRDLDCVEIFAGVGSIAAAAADKGLRVAAYGKGRIPGATEETEDILTLRRLPLAALLQQWNSWRKWPVPKPRSPSNVQ